MIRWLRRFAIGLAVTAVLALLLDAAIDRNAAIVTALFGTMMSAAFAAARRGASGDDGDGAWDGGVFDGSQDGVAATGDSGGGDSGGGDGGGGSD